MALHRLAILLLLSSVGSASASSADKTPSAQQIIDAALARAQEMKSPENKFTFLISETSDKLDKQGEVRESEHSLLRNIPMGTVSHRKLIEKNGNPLTAEEEREERDREEKFRREISCDEASPRDEDENEDKIEFNRDLISRYQFKLESVKEIDERPTYVVSFAPRPGPLPVNRRMDRALNHSQGTIWVDSENYEIAKVHFVMNKPLRIWWGMIGTIRSVEGKVERSPVEEGVWLPRRFEFLIDGRIFFRGMHLRELVEWSDFERMPESHIAKAVCD